MLTLSEPRIIERGPYLVVGATCTFEGQDEGPGWSGASRAFGSRETEIENRVDDMTLGFLYRPLCFACSPPRIDPPPYIEYVHIKIEEQQV